MDKEILLVKFNTFEKFEGGYAISSNQFPLGFLHCPLLLAKYITYMRDFITVDIDINIARVDERLNKLA